MWDEVSLLEDTNKTSTIPRLIFVYLETWKKAETADQSWANN